MGKDLFAVSLGLSSPAPEATSRAFRRQVLRRLTSALGARDATELLQAGAMTVAAVLAEEDAAAGARRMAAVLEAVLLVPASELPAPLGALFDDAFEALLALAAGAPSPDRVAARLERLWRDVASALVPEVQTRNADLEGAVAECLATQLGAGATLGKVARALGYSPSHASTVIRRTTGTSFSALRRRMQLGRALWLLEQGRAIKEAAIEAGFSDPAYFSRVFRRVYGVSPTQWRRRPSAASVKDG